MSLIEIAKEMYDLMFYNNVPKPNDKLIRYFSKITNKYYESDKEYDAILLVGKRGVHDHGGKLRAEKFYYMRNQKIKVVFGSRIGRWWIKYPSCNSCSLKTDAREGKDFDFV